MNKKANFNEFRFDGLHYISASNKYLTMQRVSDNEDKIVVKVADSHLKRTKYGYALILDYNHVVFIKDWQVSSNYYGNEVLLTREYFKVKEWGEFDDFGEVDDENELTYDYWLEIAKDQSFIIEDDGIKSFGNPVRWDKWNKEVINAIND